MNFFVTAWRSFVWSWKHLARNAWLGLATVFVLAMALLSVNVLLSVHAMMGRVVALLENKVDVTVTFHPTAPAAVVDQARFYLTSLPQVKTVQYLSAEDAMKQFRERHKAEPKVLSALDELGSNPLGAQLIVKASRPDDYAFLMRVIQNPQYTDFIQSQSADDHQLIISRVERIGRNVRLFGSALVALFAFFGLLIAFNAIRVAIYTHRDEIGIMRLVGAPNAFIRSPFLLESVWLTLLAVLLAAAVFLPSVYWIEPILRPLFDGSDPGILAFFQANALTIAVVELGGLLFSVLFVSWAAVGRYLHK